MCRSMSSFRELIMSASGVSSGQLLFLVDLLLGVSVLFGAIQSGDSSTLGHGFLCPETSPVVMSLLKYI